MPLFKDKMKICILFIIMITMTNYASSQLLTFEVMNNNVTLIVNPQFIVEGLASQVDIECTFKRDNVPSIASVLSIVIAYSNETNQSVFNSLALINEMDGHAHNVSYGVEVISGSIDNNGESKLHMRFRYPETHLFGLYMCEVTGFNQIGKPVSIYSTAHVVKYNATDLVDLLLRAQRNISAMQAYIESLQTLQPTLCPNYYPSFFYNGHEYFLSHALDYFNYTEMQSICETFGGYLVEVDTHEEFIFIRDYLVKLNIGYQIFTGATDEEQEGFWINKHNVASILSFDWASGQPENLRIENCQCFYVSFNWFLGDYYCYYSGPNTLYICEVPR